MPGGRTGRRRRRIRRFSTGVSVVRLRLGFIHRRIINPSNQIGAIYVPTKWGGTFTVRATRTSDGSAKRVRLFYKGGTITNPPTAEEIRSGQHALGPESGRFRYNVPVGRMGWFFVVVSGTSRANVSNWFIQRHSLSRLPWNSWYWPHADNKNPNLYDHSVRYIHPRGGPEAGPLAKYDQYIVQTNPTAASARDYEWNSWGRTTPRGSVGGHCDAIAWAGFEETRFRGSKRVGGINFREQDRLGLCTERYWVSTNGEVNVDEPGTAHHLFRKTGRYLDATWFHNKLRTRIADDNGGVIVFDTRNWNYGVFQYRTTFVACGTSDTDIKKVTITNRMTFVNWGTRHSRERMKWYGGPNLHLTTTYKLDYNADGTIRPQLSLSSWAKDSVRRIGGRSTNATITKVYYKKASAPIMNGCLNKRILERIFR